MVWLRGAEGAEPSQALPFFARPSVPVPVRKHRVRGPTDVARRVGWVVRLVCLFVVGGACTQRVTLQPRGEGGSSPDASFDAGARLDAETTDSQTSDADGDLPAILQIPSAEALLAVADGLPTPRRVGTVAARDAFSYWRGELTAIADDVRAVDCDVVRWIPETIDLRVRSGTVSETVPAVTSEASGAANLVDVGWIPEGTGIDPAGRVVVVPATYDSDLRLRLREYPNVERQTIAAIFDTYWRLADAGALGAIFVLPDAAPPGMMPVFPSVPDLGRRMPAALISESSAARLTGQGTITWQSSVSVTATRAQSLIARVPGPAGAPTVALMAPLDAPQGGRSFDAALAAAWGVATAMASVPVDDRPIELVLVHSASHWFDPGRCVQAVIDREVLDAWAGVDVVVDLYAPVGVDRSLGVAAERVAWRPMTNDVLDRWLAAWPSPLSVRSTIPPGDIDGIERRLSAVPRVTLSAAYDHRYFVDNADLPLPKEDLRALVQDLLTWLNVTPDLRSIESPVARVSTAFSVPTTASLPGLPPRAIQLGMRAATPTRAVDAVVLAIGGLEAPAEVIFDGGRRSATWLGYLASRGIAAYAVDITGSGRSTRPDVTRSPVNWVDADGTLSPDATYPFLLHSSDSIVDDIGAALDGLQARHPGRKIHLVGQGVMGGYALWAAREWPDRVASVMTFGTPGLFIFPELPGALPASGRPATLLTRAALAARWGPMVQRLDQIDKTTLDTVWLDLLDTETPAVRTRDAIRLPTAAIYGLTRTLVQAVEVPVLVAYGAFDSDAPAFLVRGLYEELTAAPRRWMVGVDGASHFAAWERVGPRVFELHRRWIVDSDALGRPTGVATYDGTTFSWEAD